MVPLIHRDSVSSPFFNPSLDIYQQNQLTFNRSISRARNISITTNPISGYLEYLMVFYVGTPPRLVYASLDTGSDLLWFQCVPCKHCLSQYIHIFNPTKSLTFRKSACHSPECNTLGLDRSLCNSSNEPCNYLAVYGISVSTITAANGTLSIDKFKLEDTNRTAVEVGFLTFGCSDDLSQSYEGNPGIVGLNRQQLSLISQLGVNLPTGS